MRHRAPRPLIDLWLRLPRASARLVGGWARPAHVRVLVSIVVLLGLGTTAYVAGTSLFGDPSRSESQTVGLDRPDSSASPDDEQLDPNTEPGSDAPSPTSSESESDTDSPRPRETPSTATSDAPALRTDVDPGSGSPSPEGTTPSDTTSADATPPETSLTEEFPAAGEAQFWFTANEAASFTCSLDGAAYTPCESGVRYSDLDPAWHTFSVRAVDGAGNVDPTPANIRWQSQTGRTDS